MPEFTAPFNPRSLLKRKGLELARLDRRSLCYNGVGRLFNDVCPLLQSPSTTRALPTFTGLSKSAIVDTILGSLRQWLPVSSKRSRELKRVEAWALFRFTGFGTRNIARLPKTTVAEVDEAIRSVRALREKERAWWRAIWNAEWALRWRLYAAPWRE